jgi:large subunit ribosomal protein L14
LEYKGFKKKNNKKGDVCRALIIRTVLQKKKKDNTTIRFLDNSGVLIRKKVEFRSKYFYGPISTILRKKKIISLFPYLL